MSFLSNLRTTVTSVISKPLVSLIPMPVVSPVPVPVATRSAPVLIPEPVPPKPVVKPSPVTVQSSATYIPPPGSGTVAHTAAAIAKIESMAPVIAYPPDATIVKALVSQGSALTSETLQKAVNEVKAHVLLKTDDYASAVEKVVGAYEAKTVDPSLMPVATTQQAGVPKLMIFLVAGGALAYVLLKKQKPVSRGLTGVKTRKPTTVKRNKRPIKRPVKKSGRMQVISL